MKQLHPPFKHKFHTSYIYNLSLFSSKRDLSPCICYKHPIFISCFNYIKLLDNKWFIDSLLTYNLTLSLLPSYALTFCFLFFGLFLFFFVMSVGSYIGRLAHRAVRAQHAQLADNSFMHSDHICLFLLSLK